MNCNDNHSDFQSLINNIHSLFSRIDNPIISAADQKVLQQIGILIEDFLISSKEQTPDSEALLEGLQLLFHSAKHREPRITKQANTTAPFDIITSSGSKITLGTCIGTGGEGSVYALPSLPGTVAKIFHSHIKLEAKKARLEALIKYKSASKINHLLVAAIPEELLYRDNGDCIGYLMPQISSNLKIFHVLREDSVRKYFPDLTYKGLIIIAYNLAELVAHLHANGIVIGDMNPNNISVYPDGTICFIDCDSFDFTDPETKKHFRCTVGLPELLAPELQKSQTLANSSFTKESDSFSLAIHIFRLLMDSADPFTAQITQEISHSYRILDTNHIISHGESPYFREFSNKEIPAWVPSIEILSDEIQELFRRSFCYDISTIEENIKNRPTPKEWMEALLRFYQMPFKQCSSNPRHYYLAKFTTCPLCHKKL